MPGARSQPWCCCFRFLAKAQLGLAGRRLSGCMEALGIRYGTECTSRPGKFYEYPGDPLASGVGTPVNHIDPT